MKKLAIITAMVLLAGCEGVVATGLRAASDTVEAVDILRADLIERNRDLRRKGWAVQDIVIQMHTDAAVEARVNGDTEAAMTSAAAAGTAIGEAKPDAVAIINEIRRIRAVIENEGEEPAP